MKLFVTGATGFVGREIVRQLHEEGHAIRILVRDPTARGAQAAISSYGVELHRGDVADAASLAGTLDGIEVVMHLVGIISEVGQSTFERVHTLGTQAMVMAAQKAGIRRFVHMSALGTRPNAVSRYHQTKWAAEELVRRSGLDYTIFRPSIIYGPQDEFVNLFARIIRLSPIVPLLDSPSARFQPIPVEDVATAFVRALGEPRAVGQTFDLAGPEVLSLSEIVEQIQTVLHRKRWKFRVPASLAWAQGALLEFVYPRLLGKAPPLNRDQLIMLQEDNLGDGRPANELFGLRPTGLKEGIARYLARDARNGRRGA